MKFIQECYDGVMHYHKAGAIRWPMVIFITLIHVAAIIGVFTIPQCSWYTLLWAFLCWPISGLGITAGAHRLWAHRSYKASFGVRLFLMLANSMASQGPIYHWARDHRVHHKHSEEIADPHNATLGFFYSHVGWLLVKKDPATALAGAQLNFDDLKADPIVMWQKKNDPWFNLFMCFAFPGLVCMLWGDSFWHGYWVAGALRFVFVLHATWCVNSVAHLWGERPYAPEINPAENFWVALVAIGEGWHNWHHKYPYDYATSEGGIIDQFNPTKAFIDTMCFFGLAWDCKRATGAWQRLKTARLEEQMKELNSPTKVLITAEEKELDARGW